MSLTLLAIVGGALAFKAKFNTKPMCTTSTSSFGSAHNDLTSCPSVAVWSTQAGGTTTYYTTDQDGGDCLDIDNNPLSCGISTTLKKEGI